jgi:hypothetical protein
MQDEVLRPQPELGSLGRVRMSFKGVIGHTAPRASRVSSSSSSLVDISSPPPVKRVPSAAVVGFSPPPPVVTTTTTISATTTTKRWKEETNPYTRSAQEAAKLNNIGFARLSEFNATVFRRNELSRAADAIDDIAAELRRLAFQDSETEVQDELETLQAVCQNVADVYDLTLVRPEPKEENDEEEEDDDEEGDEEEENEADDDGSV